MNSISGFWKDQLTVKDFTLLYSDCNSEIAPEEKSHIIADLDESLPGYDVQQYFGTQPNIFRDYDHLVVARDSTGNTVGLLGSKWFSSAELTYLYLWTAMIAEGARKSGLLTSIFLWELSKVVKEKTTPPLIATKTYNPIVYKAMNALHHLIAGSRFYPTINGSSQDDTAVVVGGQGVLAPNFFPELPSSRDPKVDSYFESNLTRNDQILMIVDIPTSSYQAVDVLLRNAAMTNFASLRSAAVVS
jgi:hypothetical protein